MNLQNIVLNCPCVFLVAVVKTSRLSLWWWNDFLIQLVGSLFLWWKFPIQLECRSHSLVYFSPLRSSFLPTIFPLCPVSMSSRWKSSHSSSKKSSKQIPDARISKRVWSFFSFFLSFLITVAYLDFYKQEGLSSLPQEIPHSLIASC